MCSTDDRYATDVHYMGGCLLASDMLPWASTMLAFNARPPDPAFVGERWREMWLERLEHTPPFAQAWIAHQRRDAFWKHGSVCEEFDAIQVPVYMVGGWQDAYTDAVFRFLGGYGGPAKGLVGPWGHLYPQSGAPGPAIGFLQECLRFWDHCLKADDNHVLDEPVLRAFMQEWVDPTAGHHAVRPGRWVAEPAWPPAGASPRVLHLRADGVLGDAGGDEAELAITGSQLTGLHSGPWCGWGAPGDDPGDQRAEDGRSPGSTSEPLGERTEILGFPEVALTPRLRSPARPVAVRLCGRRAIGPRRRSWPVASPISPIVTTRIAGAARAGAPLPGRRAWVRRTAFGPGHRIRVAVSLTYRASRPSPEPVHAHARRRSASRLSRVGEHRAPRTTPRRRSMTRDRAPLTTERTATARPAAGSRTTRDRTGFCSRTARTNAAPTVCRGRTEEVEETAGRHRTASSRAIRSAPVRRLVDRAGAWRAADARGDVERSHGRCRLVPADRHARRLRGGRPARIREGLVDRHTAGPCLTLAGPPLFHGFAIPGASAPHQTSSKYGGDMTACGWLKGIRSWWAGCAESRAPNHWRTSTTE